MKCNPILLTVYALTLTFITLPTVATSASSVAGVSDDGLWAKQPVTKHTDAATSKRQLPLRYRKFVLNQARLAEVLDRSPSEHKTIIPQTKSVIPLPMPDGKIAKFQIMESPILSPKLSARYPGIKTYSVQGIDDPGATGRLDVTPMGFHAYVFMEKGTLVIDPLIPSASPSYISYWKRDVVSQAFKCLTDENKANHMKDLFRALKVSNNPSGDQLRTYRLAVSATGEYTRWAGGLVPGCVVGGATWPACGRAAAAAQITTTINRVTGIYEREVAIRLNLTATNIYDDPNGATEPFTGNSVSAMMGQNQTDLDANVGSANYDIGHVFSQGPGGGVANAGVCNNSLKARGATTLTAPFGDVFDVDYVSHEMGHQFSASHTWNANVGACSGTGQYVDSSAYEPGSASTIMGYAGICPGATPNGGQNVQPNSDAYFHTRSFDQITAFRDNAATGGSCGTQTVTGNNIPVADAGIDYTIPQDTPFTLTATGTDGDSDALSFNWEQYDNAGPRGLPASTNTTGPLFRSRAATVSPSRTIPQLADILAAAPGSPTTTWEVLPTVNRALNFRVTARDNRAGGGGVDWDNMKITVNGSFFRLSAPAGGDALECGDSESVNWVVGGGSVASNINILLSEDDGTSFPTTLIASTTNDGSQAVTLPANVRTTSGRIKLEPTDNIFFAISGKFSITDTLDPSISAPADLPAVECTSPSGAPVALGTATATDLCDASLTIFNDAPVGDFPLGSTSVTWTAADDASNSSTDTQLVTVVDTTIPQITPPADITAECTSPTGTPVAIGTATATDICDASVAINNNAPTLFSLGATPVTWTATDDNGNANSAIQTVTIQDTTPPDFTVSVTPTVLWPPKHQLVTIRADIVIDEACDVAPTVSLMSITSNEPDNGNGDGNTVNDIQGAAFGTDDREFQLRAERSGKGNGRIYTITYLVSDASGNTTTKQVTVTVPKSQGR